MLTERGHTCIFATPDAAPARADPRMLRGTGTGTGPGLLGPLLRAQSCAVADHDRMAASAAFRTPIEWAATRGGQFDALLLPGGHAPGMR